MPKSLHVRLNEAVDVSGAFDNCFFHALTAHILAGEQKLPDQLFTFESILGRNSYASQLQGKFTCQEDLSLFAKYTKETSSPFLVEKSLVLGFLMREWFATLLTTHTEHRDKMEADVVKSFKNYKAFRSHGLSYEDLLSGAEGVLYIANKPFLDYFFSRPKSSLNDGEKLFEQYFIDSENDADSAIKAYWAKEGYQAYCRELAMPQTKLSYQDVMPVMTLLNLPVTIYDRSGSLIASNLDELACENSVLEVALDVQEGHYWLLKTNATESMLQEYETSYGEYKRQRAALLENPASFHVVAEGGSALLAPAICPPGHLNQAPFNFLLEKIELMEKACQQVSLQPPHEPINADSMPSNLTKDLSEENLAAQVDSNNEAASDAKTSVDSSAKSNMNYNFLLNAGAVLFGLASIAMGVILLLAINSILAVPAVGMCVIAGAGIAAGLTSVGLFKSRGSCRGNDNLSPEESEQEQEQITDSPSALHN